MERGSSFSLAGFGAEALRSIYREPKCLERCFVATVGFEFVVTALKFDAKLRDEDLIHREEAILNGVVHVVDDDASFVVSIERRLKIAGYSVSTYPTAQQLLDNVPEEQGPCCILLDVQIPGLSGPELQNRLIGLGSKIPIIFLTGHGDIQTSVKAIKAGAEDFLVKPVSSGQLLEAIKLALSRHAFAIDRERKLLEFRARLSSLTARERQVFDLVILGKINKQIAFELGTTERTIKAHRHQVMDKMKVQSLAALVSIANQLKLATSDSDAPLA